MSDTRRRAGPSSTPATAAATGRRSTAADAVDVIDNPFYPLLPGSRWVYEGTSDGETERIEVEVLAERRTVMGIAAVVVRDQAFVDGELAEDTLDFFTQDAEGNVWYLGEETAEYEGGEVTSTAGSWEAGVDGALPGIVMLADPAVGEAYRQEFLRRRGRGHGRGHRRRRQPPHHPGLDAARARGDRGEAVPGRDRAGRRDDGRRR